MKKVAIVLLMLASPCLADELDTHMYGTVNGIVVLKDLQNGTEFYLDFQGSKAEKLPQCTCHTSYLGWSTSRKSTIDVCSGIEGWVSVDVRGKIYEQDLLEGDEMVDVEKHEKKYEYRLITFTGPLVLTNREDESDKLELRPESVLVYCFKK